jgi:hypothetical protein
MHDLVLQLAYSEDVKSGKQLWEDMTGTEEQLLVDWELVFAHPNVDADDFWANFTTDAVRKLKNPYTNADQDAFDSPCDKRALSY